jgi:predicted amidophosphoribosyltransferase
MGSVRPRTSRAIRLKAFRCPRCLKVIGKIRPRCSRCGKELPKFK